MVKTLYSLIFVRMKKVKAPELFFVLITVYIVFSIVYAYERMLNTDCSYQLFQVVNFKKFFFQENRFGVIFTQIPLLIGVYLHLPMKLLLYVYSVSFPLEYLIIIWINASVFKCREAALATVLSLLIGVSSTFFHSITETHQVLAISSLLYGFLYSRGKEITGLKSHSILVGILVWALLTHPIAIFAVLFVIGFSVIQNKTDLKKAILSAGFCLLILTIKLVITPKGGYDGRVYQHLYHFRDSLHHFFALYPYQFFVSRIPTTYFSFIVILFLVWLKSGKYSEMIFCTCSFLAFTIVSILAFSAGDSDQMMEKSFMPGIFMFVLLFSVLYYRIEKDVNYYALTLVLCSLTFINIANASREYRDRLNLLSGILDGMPCSSPKLIVGFSDFDQNIDRFNFWANSMDALILSKCSGDRCPKTIFFAEDKYKCSRDTVNTDLFLYLNWNPYGMEDLNPDYFDLPSVSYKIYGGGRSVGRMKSEMLKNPDWIGSLIKRSKERGISIDSIMTLEAQWIMDHEGQK